MRVDHGHIASKLWRSAKAIACLWIDGEAVRVRDRQRTRRNSVDVVDDVLRKQEILIVEVIVHTHVVRGGVLLLVADANVTVGTGVWCRVQFEVGEAGWIDEASRNLVADDWISQVAGRCRVGSIHAACGLALGGIRKTVAAMTAQPFLVTPSVCRLFPAGMASEKSPGFCSS